MFNGSSSAKPHPRQVGVTLQGELFSAAWLARLARAAGLEAAVAEAGALLDTAWLLGLLASPGLVLVPYDCSATGAVCLERGHKGRLMKNVITTLNLNIFCEQVSKFLSTICSIVGTSWLPPRLTGV